MFKTIKEVLTWTSYYRKPMLRGFFYSFLASMFSALPYWITAQSIIVAYQQDSNLASYKHLPLALFSLLAIVTCILLRFTFLYLKAKNQESAGFKVAAKTRLQIAERLKHTSMGYFSQNNLGSLINAMTTELSLLELQSTKMIDLVVNGYINFLTVTLFMFIIDWRIGLVTLCAGLIATLILEKINQRSQQNTLVANKIQMNMANYIIEFIKGMSVAKTYGQGSHVLDGVKQTFHQSKSIRIKIQKKIVTLNAIFLVVLDLSTVAIMALIALDVFNQQLALSMGVVLFFFAFILFASIKEMNNATHILGAVQDNLNHLNHLKQMPVMADQGIDIDLKHFNIEFKDVSFQYSQNQEMVLKHLDIKIPENKTTAIIGPSGSGKSTLCKLISRFYDPAQGQVLINGHNVKEFSDASLLKNISIVFQKSYLFHDTIKNNILFGKPNASMAEVIAASKKACCHDFIMALAQQYDTILDEGGSSISGGQRQRIAIARAILKNAPIIILDEATASVDPENEQVLQQAIASLVANKTIITIAHRLATIQNADQILVMSNGELVQQGIHKTLMKQKGIYRDFVNVSQSAQSWHL